MAIEIVVDVVRLEEKLIIEAFREAGLDVTIVNLKNTPITWSDLSLDASIIRPISMYKAVYTASIRESTGIYTVNNSRSLLVSGDKILTLSVLKKVGIPFPETIIAFSGEAVLSASKIIDFPFVDKPPVGSWGRLVTLVRDIGTLKSIIEHREMMLSQSMKTHLIQRFIESDGKKDIRVLTIGDHVVGAVARIPNDGEWRSNVALGGKTEPYKLDEELEEIVLKTVKEVGGEFMAIDLFVSDGRYLVNEVNGVPEFKGFMKALKINVHKLLAKYVKDKLKK
ncbi:MAG: lysine biosynthesis protein LysX [Nitrososphaerota archaeon]